MLFRPGWLLQILLNSLVPYSVLCSHSLGALVSRLFGDHVKCNKLASKRKCCWYLCTYSYSIVCIAHFSCRKPWKIRVRISKKTKIICDPTPRRTVAVTILAYFFLVFLFRRREQPRLLTYSAFFPHLGISRAFSQLKFLETF